MKRFLYAVGLLLGAAPASVSAQTNDINFLVAPSFGYTWSNPNVNLGGSTFWGARAGWSLGQNLELYGTYERTFDLKASLKEGQWSVFHTLGNKLQDSKASIERRGAEIKVNFLPNTIFTPYVFGGAGYMTLRRDAIDATDQDYREELLYANLGLGAKFNINRRIAFRAEVRNTLFNLDEFSHYRTSTTAVGKTLHNWSAIATVDFYLGGMNRTDDPIEKAYRAKYSGGYRGLTLTAEPTVTYISFNSLSPMNDQWFVGAAAGVDFSSILGVRGFYQISTAQPGKFSFKLDDQVQFYGANLIGRLNYLRGLTPYLTLGGGYMNVSDRYIDRHGTQTAHSGWFAMGGVGLEMPIHRSLSLFGSLNAMLNEQENPTAGHTYRPSQIKTNLMYQFGVRVRLGSLGKSGQQQYQEAMESALRAERNRQFYETQRLRTENDSLRQFNDPLATDSISADSLKVSSLSGMPKTLLLTPQQLNMLIDSVVTSKRAADSTAAKTIPMSDLDKILLFALTRQQGAIAAPAPTPSNEEVKALLRRIEKLEKELLKRTSQRPRKK